MFSSVRFIQFIQFHQNHYKSKMPIGYRISWVKYIQILMHKDTTHKVTIIIRAGNKMSLMYGYLIDWFNCYDWSIHFHNCIWYGPRHKIKHIILNCIYIAAYGDSSPLYNITYCCFFFKEFRDFSHLFTAYSTDFS
jgi:hypothetical protein